MRISDWSSDVCSSVLVAIAGTTLRHRGDDVLAHRRAGDDGENLALEAVRGPANTDRLGHVVRRRRDGQRDIVGDMDEFALRQQGKAGERVGILTARQRAEPPDRRVIDAERAAVAAGPSQLLGPRRTKLALDRKSVV